MKKLLLLTALTFCFGTKAQIISTVAGNGAAGYFGDGGPATSAVLYDPDRVTFDAAGNMYIVDNDNSRIRMVNTAGIISTFAGNGTHGFYGDGGPATGAELNGPTGVCFDVTGNMYIADYLNDRIRKVNTAGIISTFAGNGTSGFSGDGGYATAATFRSPSDVIADAAGNIYIVDPNNYCVRMVNTAGIISTFAGNGVSGFSGDGGSAIGAELSPSALALDAIGNVYITDGGHQRIRKVNTAGIITTVAGNGTFGYAGDGGQATAAAMQSPNGISFDLIGNMYIADEDNDRIRRVSTAGIISTIAGNGYDAPGSGGYAGDGGPATAAELNHPSGVGFDATGNLYIADNNNDVIRKITCTPIVNISGVASVCPGGGTTLTAGGANIYIWSSNAGSVQTSTVALSPAVATVYTVTGTSVFGCAATQTISVQVNSLPVVSIFGNSSVCIGGHTTLTGFGANTYTWSSNAGGSNTNAVSVAPTGNTTYTVSGTDGNGCTNSDTITVVVNALPVVTVGNGTICAGQSFTIMPSGANTYTYSSGSDVVTPAVTTNYTVTGTDGNDCENNPPAICTVMVNTSPSVSITANTTTLCVGNAVTLTASGATTYTWSTTATTTTISATPTVTTNYTVTGTDGNGCINNDTLSIVVINCTTGIDELVNNNTISIYPNPTSTIINVKLKMQGGIQGTNLYVTDVLGNTVKQSLISNLGVPSGSFSIDVSDLANGVYFIKTTQGTSKFIKQ